ncbi:MAG: hypothetical protein CMM77_01795 [Rhodospirillaceae bacterium]|nr:hypothetical protein [Rhodospirillaceae bacterium]|tara:strand:+ start:120 stop:404 length:285 start_codon:yes stop_codon:yes gene_type:complete
MSLSSAKKTAAVLGFLSFVPFATAVSAQEIATLPVCEQVISDTLKSKDENPGVGEQAELLFNQLVERARTECADGNFRDAADTLNQARALVAAE